ncbi:LacI family DNA-binding transcriptional regulator [Devosia rhodophyticola]|uniref:LacI family DNA-binding transcriptional regulator n=1 Tax=Devosia rhodophyticola TaxID=3026423 RepID=A0ABY7Z133_9HYPH|nr:LacI family DNA-binding transcriptional regulator [Devosia rhodophyticola]WDR07331.1 LacI family DNA-binding transcriptional regulator [Devosia rhodophyticola]
MNEITTPRRATVHDVARAAGVSLATVDRVLNNRPGVRPTTARKVADAVTSLGFQRDLSASLLARARDLQVRFLIPAGSNEFMDSLADAASRRIESALIERLQIAITRLPLLDARALVDSLDVLMPHQCDCAVIVGTEEPAVLASVEEATRRGVMVMTLVSDLPGSSRRHFIGIDNVAAGRTAASLMGRFCPQGGKIALVAGSMHLHDHHDRLEGFRAVAAEYPGLELLEPLEGHDEHQETQALVEQLLARHSDLGGIYNLGAGTTGLLAALRRTRRTGSLRVIAHELSDCSRAGLADGSIDVVLDQNPDGEIGAALAAVRTLALGAGTLENNEPIEIRIFLRDNLG